MTLALTRAILRSRGGNHAIKYQPRNKQERAFVRRHEDRAEEYAGMSFLEIAAECIGYDGRIVMGSRRAGEILTRAFESTSDYPSIFENVLNKALLARYELAVPTYRKIAEERPFNDFRPHPQVRAFEFPAPKPVLETGELQVGTSSDSNTLVSVAPYGIIFTISREMLVNDELGAIDQIIASAGLVVGVWENTQFFTMLLSNPIYSGDGQPIFSSAHNNVVELGDGASPSVSTIGAGRAAFRSQQTPSGYYLNVEPKIILTGPQQETAAQQMITRITPTLTTSVNPFENGLQHVSDANIQDTSWYLLADQDVLPAWMFGHLKGDPGPRIRTHAPFGFQGIQMSLEEDFGTGALDFRGTYKNAGS